MELKRILVPTDFSDASRQVLPRAVELAGPYGASLLLTYVFPTGMPAELGHIGLVLEKDRLLAEAKERLTRFRAQELPAQLAVETIVLEGGPAPEIVRLAQEREVDLILTATHGHTGLTHLWLGSTAERIVRHAPCPVLVVRERSVPVRLPNEAPGRFRRILVPTDFSEAAGKSLRYATALAQPGGGEIILVHVIEPPPYPEFGYGHIPQKEAGLKREAAGKLERMREELVRSGLQASVVVRHGSAFREITDHARDENIDLVVVSTGGHGALAHALLGSTAERIVRHAPCPVLVVREKERDFVPTH